MDFNFISYSNKLSDSLNNINSNKISILEKKLLKCWTSKKQVFFCGNGGSAGNANHLANDFIYGVAKKTGSGFKVHSLSSNQSVITCLANDCGYESIYSEQLATLGNKGDLLICLSGSGNSPNILKAINVAKNMGIFVVGVLGYDGGKAKKVVDLDIHIKINDMQISEDFQLIVFHYLMQSLYRKIQDNV